MNFSNAPGEPDHRGIIQLLSSRRGFQAVFIERLPGERVHTLAVKLGGVLPLHVGASPRALLAFEPDAFWDEYFAAVSVEPWMPSSPADEAGVRELLYEIRRTGVAISDEDVVAGVSTVGAPIFDHRGAVRAALAFNLLPETFRRARDRYVELARAASVEASRAFGYDLVSSGLPPNIHSGRLLRVPYVNVRTGSPPVSGDGASPLMTVCLRHRA